jgi:hypothetical protein
MKKKKLENLSARDFYIKLHLQRDVMSTVRIQVIDLKHFLRLLRLLRHFRKK